MKEELTISKDKQADFWLSLAKAKFSNTNEDFFNFIEIDKDKI